MPWSGNAYTRTDGTRTGSDVWAQAKAAGVDIVADDHDTHDEDMADAIQDCLKKDGNNAATGDVSWGGNKITSLGNATADTDALNRQTGDARYLTVSGTIQAQGDLILGDANADAANLAIGSADTFLKSDGTTAAWGSPELADLSDVDGSLSLSDDQILSFVNANSQMEAVYTVVDEDDMSSDSATALPTQQSTKAYVDTKIGEITGFNAQTGTAYTAVLADSGKAVTMNNASANTFTIPTNASVAFPVGSWITIIQIGAGTTTVTGDTGVTVNGVSAGGADSPFKYAFLTAVKVATDEWYLNVDGVA